MSAGLNALRAVELDPVRRRERLLDQRLAAAVTLAPALDIAEVLLAGVPMPARRLEGELVSALALTGNVVLDEELALRVAAHGPLSGPMPPLRRRA